ncbi:hypothetical protein IW139_006730, partial [Coemansia sp. RSA 353]
MSAQRQVAIVSPIAGTTRDIVETTLDIGGYPLVVRDTAGLRKASSDVIEMEGIRRAVEAAQEADIRICMVDAQQALDCTTKPSDSFLQNAEWQALLDLPHTFVVLSKIDTLKSSDGIQAAAQAWAQSQRINNRIVPISCANMFGWESLMQLLADDIRTAWGTSVAQQMPLTKTRHRQHLQQCLEHLDSFESIGEDMVVLGAEELRGA